MKDITPILSSLGLLDSEIRVYLAALENGAGTVIDLTKLTKLSRQAVYVAIDTLTKRGLMSSALRGKKRFYAAEHPSKLLAFAHRYEDELKERMADLERMLPELELAAGGEKPIVRVFEGKEGIRAIIEEMKNTKFDDSIEITDLDAMYKVLTPEDLKSMRLEVKRSGALFRGLYAGESLGNTIEGVRINLPSEFSGFKSNIGIYGDNKLVLVTFEGKMHSIIIESKALTKAVRILFEMVFRGSKK